MPSTIEVFKRSPWMETVNYAFVWKEEQEWLEKLADKVPENGALVEIGTARGGTAMIFHQALRNKNVKIYSVDSLDCARARSNLRNTDVYLVNLPSREFAEIWKNDIRIPIDLLYIDGDHNFCGIFEDFNAWFPLVALNGTVAFHDYDPLERGGLAHLGVKICLDTVIAKGFLSSVRHDYKIVSGMKENNDMDSLDWRDCFRTFTDMGERICVKREEIFKVSLEEGLDILRSRKLPFDSVQACYCLDHALKHDFECVDSRTTSFHDFRRWLEMLSVFEHARGPSPFPEQHKVIIAPENHFELSRMIAHEQVRISILARILKTIVRWEP